MNKNIYFIYLKCIKCNRTFPPDSDLLLCPNCSNLLDPVYDLERFKADLPKLNLEQRNNTIWKWKELLPIIDFDAIVTMGEGGSALLQCDSLAKKMGVKGLYILNDASGMPTGSLKDRSVAISVTKAVEFGYPILSCDSTGNKAASVAAYAAWAGIKSIVFCPWDTPLSKMAQAVFYGAKLIRIRGDFAKVQSMYRRLIYSGQFEWYDSGSDNPFRYEGKKTYAYEIASNLNWKVPSMILHPAGGCMSLVKTWKGFKELKMLGFIDSLPSLTACQASACAPIVQAWKRGESEVKAVKKEFTIASAIACADPGILGDETLKTINESKGYAIAVDDEKILHFWKQLGHIGIFCEPSSAISVAAAFQLAEKNILSNQDVLICIITGSGFKDFDTLQSNVEISDKIIENYEELEREVRNG